MLFSYPSVAQDFECMMPETDEILLTNSGYVYWYNGVIPLIYDELPITACDDYRKYAPINPSFMPIKTLQVVVHVVRLDDGTRNFQDTPEDREHIQNLIDRVNDDYSNLFVPDYIDTNCIPEVITDSRIRFNMWSTIFFHDDSDFWCEGQTASMDMFDLYVTNNTEVSGELKKNAIHLFLVGCKDDMDFTSAGIASGIPSFDKKFVTQGGYYHDLVENPVSWALVTSALTSGHEFGHCLGLFHVHSSDYCCDTFNGIPGETRNMMDGHPISRRLTECQLARMHHYLEGKCSVGGFCGGIHDVVITDYCNKDETYDVIIPSGDNVVWEVDRKLTTDIIIETGAQLTIKCKLGLPTDANIIVNRGARLFVDGGTITHNKTMWDKCDEGQWGRIYVYGNASYPHSLNMISEFHTLNPDEPGIVLIKNGATLEYARHAISTKSLGIPWPESQDYWGGFVYAKGSFFINNHRSVEFMKYEHTNYSRFLDCDFINEDGTANVGVTNWATNGVVFSECRFKNMNDSGISAHNASMKITRSEFEGMPEAVKALATGPLLSSFEVGLNSENSGNFFAFNDVAVSATGISNLIVKNNTFENNGFGVAVSGESGYDIINNHFSESSAAIDLVQTGDANFNSLYCNTFEGDFIGIDITGDNSGMKFRNQDFATSYDVFLSNEGNDVGKLKPQGSPFAAVWNYFSSSYSNEKHINTTGTTAVFLYYHPNPILDNRIKPDCALNDNCSATNTENFINNLALGGSGDCLDDQGPPDYYTKEKLQEINDQISGITVITNPTEQDRTLLIELEEEKQTIFWALLHIYHDAREYVEMDSILLAENTKTAQKYRIGLSIERGDFAVVTTLVDDFVVETADDQYFKFTQQINIDRLTQDFSLSVVDEDMLHLIVAARTPSSAYAKGLLSILKNETFKPELPEISQALMMPNNGVDAVRHTQVDKEKTKDKFSVEKVLIYPNPAKDMINFDLSQFEKEVKLEIYDSQGRQVYQEVVLSALVNLNTEILGKGLFVAIIKQEGRIIESSKFIISK